MNSILIDGRADPLLLICQVMPPSRQSSGSRPAAGPARRELEHAERVEWHDHAEHQLIHPIRGVLNVFTPIGTWVVPSHRAVWIPARVAHAHRAFGSTRMHTLAFAADVNPLRLDRPAVIAVGPLLREVVVALTAAGEWVGHEHRAPVAAHALSDRERRNLEQVALDRLRRVDELPLHLPTPVDGRLRDLDTILRSNPADRRTLAALGTEVGPANAP
jgi:hypothetical protein